MDEMIIAANKKIMLRGKVEKSIERLWLCTDKKDRISFNRYKKDYEVHRNAMIETGIPEEDINEYNQRVKNMENLLESD